MGYSLSRAHARQMIRHGHVRVNGRKVDIPSVLVKAGDTIEPADREKSRKLFTEAIELSKSRNIPSWVEVTHDPAKGKVLELPKRDDVQFEVNELFVVEVQKR
jgi:small subunit ribosomal protein S4